MTARLLRLWESVRESYWFVPAVMLVTAAALSVATVAADRALGERAYKAGWIYAGGPEGARSLLATAASSMVTVAGVVFSITIVALTLASSQFGPRLLRNYMRDLGNQVTLGTFIATFLYCLLVSRTVRSAHEGAALFVPHLSVTTALVLTVLSLGVLVYYIHHAAALLQAPNVIANVSEELHAAIHHLYPTEVGADLADVPGTDTKPRPEILARYEEEAAPVLAAHSGYVQAIDADVLLGIARERDLVLRMLRRPGHFVIAGQRLALVWPGERMDDEIVDCVNEAFVLGTQRKLTQDLEFAIDQLVEVGVRALSPGVNDPFTAITCIDHLGMALSILAGRAMPSPYRADADGILRVIAYPSSFPEIVDAAFDQLRQHGQGSVAVSVRMLEVIGEVASQTCRAEDAEALRRQAEMLARGSRQVIHEEEDRKVIEERRARALAAVEIRLVALARRLNPAPTANDVPA